MIRNLSLLRQIPRILHAPSTCLPHFQRHSLLSPSHAQGVRRYSASRGDTNPTHYVQHAIRTLNPAFITEADYVHFPTDQDYCYIWDAYAPSAPPSSTTNETSSRRPFTIVRAGNGKPLPAGLGGYFYYYIPAGPVPPTAGEIRFRHLPNRPPLYFNQGRNFVANEEHGLPWRIPLTAIAARDSHQVFRDVLLRDGLVTAEVLARAREMGLELLAARERGGRNIPVVHSFGQPWYMDFESQVHWWHFMSADRVHVLPPIPNLLSWKIGEDRTPSPWLGAALCAFHPDPHPRQRGHRVLRVKVLKLLRPVAQNPLFPPELRYLVAAPEAVPRERAFLRRGLPFWQLDVDGDSGGGGGRLGRERREGFGALFANAGLPVLRTERALRPRAPGMERERDKEKRMREMGGEEEKEGAARRKLQSRVRR